MHVARDRSYGTRATLTVYARSIVGISLTIHPGNCLSDFAETVGDYYPGLVTSFARKQHESIFGHYLYSTV